MWTATPSRLEKTATGVRAVRQGEIAIAPPNHTPGTRLTSTQVSTKAVLRNHLEDVLKPQFELKEINLPERLKKAGPLVPSEVRAAGGWLVVGLRWGPGRGWSSRSGSICRSQARSSRPCPTP